MKYMLRTTALLCLTAMLLLVNGCKSEKKTDEAKSLDSTATDSSAVADTAKGPKILSGLPKVSEIPAMLQLTGADFNPTLINPFGKVANYSTTTDKAALNLGVYGTDIGYLSVYGKTQDIINTVKSAQKLADQVGVTQVFSSGVQKRFQDNLSVKDSLVKIVDESMFSADDYLKKADRGNTASLVAIGAFIEGLYISTGVVEKYPKDIPADIRNGVLTQLIITITKQKKSLSELIEIVKEAKQDEKVTEYTKDLESLYKVFESLNMDEQIKNNKGDLMITDKSLIDITAKVKEIRGKIVK